MMAKKYYRGVTLVEILIVIVIISILFVVAVPGFSGLIVGNQIAGNTGDFISTLRRAKTESGASNTSVILCIRDGDVCIATTDVTSTWSSGWLVFLDDNGDGLKDTTEALSYQYEDFGQDITFIAVDGSGTAVKRISFSPSGDTSLASAAIFVMCDKNKNNRRGVLVTVAGHASRLDSINGGQC
jgi:prepilin-type N-terminal cleavage/methylation domain-containing protein